MDCKDLMIGDWVVLKSNGVQPDTKIRITELSTDGGFVDDCDNFIGYEELDPIPLTEEILVKNGWEEQTDGTNDFFVSRILPELWHYVGTDYYSYDINIKIQYVHQLQHLLRLAGVQKEIEL